MVCTIQYYRVLGRGCMESDHAFREEFYINKGLPGPTLSNSHMFKEGNYQRIHGGPEG